MKIDLKKHQLCCRRCGYRWLPRKAMVVQCPSCKSALWNIKKESKKQKEGG